MTYKSSYFSIYFTTIYLNLIFDSLFGILKLAVKFVFNFWEMNIVKVMIFLLSITLICIKLY